MSIEIDIKDYLDADEIKEALTDGVRDYAKKHCAEYLKTKEGHYHGYFVKVIIDYITENYKDKLKENIESALKFTGMSMFKTTYDGKNGEFIRLLLKFMEEDKARFKAALLKKFRETKDERFQEIISDGLFSILYSLKDQG